MYGPLPTLAPDVQTSVPDFEAWQWRLQNVTLTLTKAATISLNAFVYGAGNGHLSCDELTFAINRSAPLSEQVLLPYHAGYMGWAGYKTGSLSMDSVAPTQCEQQLTIFSATGEGNTDGQGGAGNDLGCTRACINNFDVLEVRQSPDSTGFILLFPTYVPAADSIVPSCFCSMASGSVTVPAARSSPLIPDPDADIGSTTPQLSSVTTFSDGLPGSGSDRGADVVAVLTSDGDKIQMQINVWDNTNVPWGRMYRNFNVLSQGTCNMMYKIASGDIVLGTKPSAYVRTWILRVHERE
jgi:hypothetical protein